MGDRAAGTSPLRNATAENPEKATRKRYPNMLSTID